MTGIIIGAIAGAILAGLKASGNQTPEPIKIKVEKKKQ